MRRVLEEELMDRADLPLDETARALADIDRVHRWTGIGAVRRAVGDRLPEGPARLLDLGSGTGHPTARLREALRKRGVALAVVGVDRKLAHLAIGRQRGIRQMRVVADAGALPFCDGAFDASLSTLFFHHFDEATNRRILDEMLRVARRFAAVVDLRRSALARWLTGVALTLLGVGRVAAHDGRLSVAQAWSVGEVRDLVGEHRVAELTRRWPFRFSLVLDASSRRLRNRERSPS